MEAKTKMQRNGEVVVDAWRLVRKLLPHRREPCNLSATLSATRIVNVDPDFTLMSISTLTAR